MKDNVGLLDWGWFYTYGSEPEAIEAFKLVDETLFGDYNCCCYSGQAFGLFRGTDGKLYEVNGSHCSCSGLEDQWSPEECTVEDIEFRINNGSLGTGCCGNNFVEPLRAVLASLKQ